MFEPSALSKGPSGLADWPRPFVFRAKHLDGVTLTSGTCFHFDLNLFDTDTPAVPYLVSAFAMLAHEGLGPEHSRVKLLSVTQLNEQANPCGTLYENDSMTVQNIAPLEFNLAADHEPVSRLRIRFVTPTELTYAHRVAAAPEFGILAARIRDRISTLGELYGAGALNIDFRSFGERASLVRVTESNVRSVKIDRRSSRTAQVHSIGGFVGEAEYEGNLTEFLPYLRVAKWTGVGRQTVWGKGEIELSVVS